MNDEQLTQAVLGLTAAFPSLSFNLPLYREMMQDLDGVAFLKATYEFIKNTQEIFPGTNPIAILRDKTLEITREQKLLNAKLLDRETAEEERARWLREQETPEYKASRAEFLAKWPKIAEKLGASEKTSAIDEKRS